VDTHKLDAPIMQQHLKQLIEDHVSETGSEHAKMILSDFNNWLDCFVLVKPKSIAVADLLNIEQKHPELAVRVG
jgi:glutamate synthase (NADPH/NADH) large chain